MTGAGQLFVDPVQIRPVATIRQCHSAPWLVYHRKYKAVLDCPYIGWPIFTTCNFMTWYMSKLTGKNSISQREYDWAGSKHEVGVATQSHTMEQVSRLELALGTWSSTSFHHERDLVCSIVVYLSGVAIHRHDGLV